MNRKELGIYVHIPFCKQKCYYCDFVSYSNKDSCIKEYIEAVQSEIKNYKLKEYIVTTIYIGGGTPSYIKSEYIKKIIETIRNNFEIDKKCEITIEVNPGTVTKQKLQHYKQIGINRLSIGLQTTNNKLLKQIGRIHTYEEFVETYEDAKSVGFNNINVDLIIGIPNQTLEEVKKEMEQILKLNPNHISVYSLIVEEGTPLEKMIQEGKYKLPDEELERKMYWYVKKYLEQNGYNHYEISNFAKTGKESKHNQNCWEQKEYIGVGAAAHTYLDNVRYSNIENVEKYISNIKDKKYLINRIIQEKQNLEEQQKEYMLLGLRKINGISIKKFKNKFGENPIYIFRKELEKLEKMKLIQIDGDEIKLTNKGIDLANIAWQEFV